MEAKLKQSDLRIGNTYNSVKFNTPVRLTAEDIWELVARAEGASIETYIEEMFDPIPLTEEILLKCPEMKRHRKTKGLDRGNFWLWDKRIDEVSSKSLLFLYTPPEQNPHAVMHLVCPHDENIILNMRHIKYVHTFQNIIHALTNEELKITL